ncbi:hypothetical protein CTI12_AA167390 [Artemisia annua]|uniref:Uncharacterized protein n=1 Tax=Artemisia annua TaxID=35608 RepID=A0A2U1PCX7_ARTAN|nr:hypothetical protein CTI12_AA167390 [Artemisia annua]
MERQEHPFFSLNTHTINKVGQEELFELLTSMISDILDASFTRLPQVIAMKCHTSEIEKMEASVFVAGQLLVFTKKNLSILLLQICQSQMKMTVSNIGDGKARTSFFFLNTHTINKVGQEELFELLTSMISDILDASFTRLPQVIAMKCHTSEIEKMEASVFVAGQLLGETKKHR